MTLCAAFRWHPFRARHLFFSLFLSLLSSRTLQHSLKWHTYLRVLVVCSLCQPIATPTPQSPVVGDYTRPRKVISYSPSIFRGWIFLFFRLPEEVTVRMACSVSNNGCAALMPSRPSTCLVFAMTVTVARHDYFRAELFASPSCKSLLCFSSSRGQFNIAWSWCGIFLTLSSRPPRTSEIPNPYRSSLDHSVQSSWQAPLSAFSQCELYKSSVYLVITPYYVSLCTFYVFRSCGLAAGAYRWWLCLLLLFHLSRRLFAWSI